MRTTRVATFALAVAVSSGEILGGCGSTDSTSDPQDVGQAASEVQSPQHLISGATIPKFVQPLPLPSTTGGGIRAVLGNRPLSIHMCEFWAKVLPEGTFTPGVRPKTRVWGYIVGDACPPNGPDAPALDTYVGPAIVNERPGPGAVGKPGSSTDVTWINDLGSAATTQVLAYRYSTDQTLHWADPLHPDEANLCYEQVILTLQPPAFGSFCAQNYDGPIPAAVHLHGGEVPAEIDGGPESWFTSDGAHQGPGYYTFGGGIDGNRALYKYPNTQESAPIWFHDHTLGTTRLNVHAGLAGAYLLEDPGIIPTSVTTSAGTPGRCTHDCLPANLPPLGQAVPLAIQDRRFDADGQFFFTADSAGGILWNPNPQHPYWAPEFFGDTLLVNGRAWPFLDVEARRVQFLFLNGSNARAYTMSIPNGPPMYVIGTDGGYLDRPVRVDQLTMMPGERYLVILDFAGFSGPLTLTNSAPAPFPDGEAPTDGLSEIIRFNVGAPPAGGDTSYDPAAPDAAPLRPGKSAIVRLANPATGQLAVTPQRVRQLTLNEVMLPPSTTIDPVTGELTDFPGGPFEILVNNTPYEGTTRPDFVPITIGRPGETVTKFVSELPREGGTEVWEVVNLTGDAHPIHLHLVQFQLLNRQPFRREDYDAAYDALFPGGHFTPGFGPPLPYPPSAASGNKLGGNPDVGPFLIGEPTPPAPQEAGWKDTVVMPPGQVTRIVVRWAPTDLRPSPAVNPPAYLRYPFDPSNERGYVWHCHIIDHEDNDMMRPYNVPLNPNAPPPPGRPLVKGEQY